MAVSTRQSLPQVRCKQRRSTKPREGCVFTCRSAIACGMSASQSRLVVSSCSSLRGKLGCGTAREMQYQEAAPAGTRQPATGAAGQQAAPHRPDPKQHPRVGQLVRGAPQLIQLLLLGRELAAQQADVLLLQLAAALAHVGAQLGQRVQQGGALRLDLLQLHALGGAGAAGGGVRVRGSAAWPGQRGGPSAPAPARLPAAQGRQALHPGHPPRAPPPSARRR